MVTWHPFLAFAHRRLRLLEWFENHLEPIAFLESDDRAGVAIGTNQQRLVLDRRQLSIDLLSQDSKIEAMEPAVAGVLECLAPELPVVRSYSAAWSVDLTRGYDDARHLLAIRTLGPTSDALGVRAVDCAYLLDVEVPGASLQVEAGIVSPEELVARVAAPEMGRGGGERESSRDAVLPQEDLLPAASLFANIYLQPKPTVVRSAKNLVEAFDAAERKAGEFLSEAAGPLA